jgi:hypothetical protein
MLPAQLQGKSSLVSLEMSDATFQSETSMTVSVTKEDENDYTSMFFGVFMIIAII